MKPPGTLHLGTQYYRAPFPESRYWQGDFERMRDHGLDTVQLWVLWGWVEARPGGFRFDDYDRLVDLAEKVGLNVVLSTIGEIQPYWIHREVPGSELVNHRGERVYSVNRGETHFGCTPGGCTDHPEVWARMRAFLEAVAERYAGRDHLIGWDAWNELRWNIEAEGRCCYCEHTLARYHAWLEGRYGSLEGLNRTWIRRYSAWDEVWPGKRPSLPYTDTMPWLHFLTERANAHARDRYDAIKAVDPGRPVTVHGGRPTPGYAGDERWTALDRGNDWAFADHLDGVGCSSFPKWFGMDDATFAARVEYVRSAAAGKRVWLSEVQGGRAASGFQVFEPVPARDQQRWIWNGFACGADTILFWCWRDEVFGRESAGFGIDGRDGLADERLAALKVTGEVLREHGPLLAGYRPDPPEIGVLFAPQSYYLHWAQDGHGRTAADALEGYCRALVRGGLPYRVLEEAHCSAVDLDGLRLLFLPRCTALPDATAAAIADWVRGGGTLLAESECAAYGPEGIYRYAEHRFLADLAGIEEIGRRACPDPATIRIDCGGRPREIRVGQWFTPMRCPRGARILADHDHGGLCAEVQVGEGRVVALGSYAGDAYLRADGDDPDFEGFVAWLAERAGAVPGIRADVPGGRGFVHCRTGTADGRRLIFTFPPEGVDRVRLRLAPGMVGGSTLHELREGTTVEALPDGDARQVDLQVPLIGFAILAEG